MTAYVITGPDDLADQRWLKDRLDALRDGMEAARDIWLNWEDIRNVSRFAGGMAYGEFIHSVLGYSLSVEDAIAAMPGASTRQIAAVAGVTHQAIAKANKVATRLPPDQPTTVLGADGKRYPARRTVMAEVIDTPAQLDPEPVPVVVAPSVADPGVWPELRDWMRAAHAFTGTHTSDDFAASVPPGSRDRVARDLRRIGNALGRIALLLEGN